MNTSGDFVYKKVWERASNKHISCEGNRLYFENFTEWYAGCGRRLKPERVCSNLTSVRGNIEDALVSQISVDSCLSKDEEYKTCLLALTKDNWLIRHDLHTGKVLQEIYLSNKYKFRSIAWETEGHTLVLKSVHGRMTALARNAGIPMNMVLALAVFDVYPVKFVGMMKITKSVFGANVMDATLSQGLLIVMHKTGRVRMYSFPHILQQYRLTEPKVAPMTGLPLNISVTEKPPVLFELQCAEHLIEMGGTPWHYMYSPLSKTGVFHVKCLDNDRLASHGILDMDHLCVEPDRAVFHGDESGRILHIGENLICAHTISRTDDGGTKLDPCFTIDVERKPVDRWREPDFPEVSRSGRVIKRRISRDQLTNSSQVHIHDVDYENELDVLCVSSIHQHEESMSCYTQLYDNTTGQLLKEIRLREPWNLEFYEHRVTVDLDTIVQIIKPSLSKFTCIVYRLARREIDEEDM